MKADPDDLKQLGKFIACSKSGLYPIRQLIREDHCSADPEGLVGGGRGALDPYYLGVRVPLRVWNPDPV